MNSHDLFFLRAYNASFLDSSDEPLSRHLEVMRIDKGLIIAGSQQSGLIAKVGNVCSAEARSERGKPFGVIVSALSLL